MKFSRVLLGTAVFLAACSSAPDPDDLETALETGYNKDALAFAESFGVPLEGVMPPGAVRGAASGARKLVDGVERYAGGTAADVARDLTQGAAGLAKDFGIEGAEDLKSGIDNAMASDWDVVDMEVLASRSSGGSEVAQVRYDLFATIGGVRKLAASQVTHSIRLSEDKDGTMTAIPVQ